MGQGRRGRGAGAALVVAGWLGAVSFVGCSQVLGIEEDRYLAEAGTDPSPDASADASDAAEARPPEPPGWQCIDDPEPPVPNGTVQVKMLINDSSGMQSSGSLVGTPIAGATLQACDTLDLACQMPTAQATSDDGGIALITVPGGFDGFYQLNANGYPPGLIARTPQLHDESSQQGIVSASTLSLAEGLIGVMQDPNDTIAIATVDDCSSNPAVGVTIEVGAPTANEKVVYLQNKLPTPSATSTDVTGSAVVFNVPPGTVTLTAYLPGHRPIRTVDALARSGWVTYAQIRLDQSQVPPL
jgi:hypothetical protein